MKKLIRNLETNGNRIVAMLMAVVLLVAGINFAAINSHAGTINVVPLNARPKMVHCSTMMIFPLFL